MSGWKLVPYEPTAEMRRAAMNAPAYGHPETAVPSNVAIYQAMLSAAPSPSNPTVGEIATVAPTPEAGPAGFISDFGLRLIKERDDIGVTVSVLHKKFGAHSIPLYTHPAPSELVKAVEALRDFVKLDVRWNNERDRLLANLQVELDKVKS